MTRLAIVASHPIQYYAPLYRSLASKLDVTVLYLHRATAADQAAAGFGVGFDWDVDLLSGYEYAFLPNVARNPRIDGFWGCDTPTIRQRLASGHYDAVLVQGWHLKSYLQAAVAAKRLRIRLLVRGDSHLETPRSALKALAKRAIYPSFLRIFDAALYVGQRSYRYWRHYGFPEERLFFSPHCVDAEWFAARATYEARIRLRARLNIAPQRKVALFAGKLVQFKRPFDLFAAAEILKGRGKEIEIIIAGAGPLHAALAERGRSAGLTCHFLGFCNQSEMPAVFAAADLLVLPSDGNETWGLVANEALACRRPVILSDAVGSAPDLAADGKAGRAFAMGNPAALATALEELLFFAPSADSEIDGKSRIYGIQRSVEGILAAVGTETRVARGREAPVRC